MSKLLIAGCGYLGQTLGLRLIEKGHEVWGLTREAASLPLGIKPIAADLTQIGTLKNLPRDLEFVFYTAAADSSDDESYKKIYVDGMKNLLQALIAQGQKPKRFFFTSSTAVYAQVDGEWVDETSETRPVHFSGRRLLEAEALLATAPFPTTIVRLGGLYGPGRLPRRSMSTTYVNRIHRDDAAGILEHLMNFSNPDALYLGVDHEPTSSDQVLRFLSLSHDESVLSPSPRTRTTHKRCRNHKISETGYRFLYPTYREGYTAILSAGGAK